MAKYIVDPAVVTRLRAELREAQTPSADRTFIDRIIVLEHVIEVVLAALEQPR